MNGGMFYNDNTTNLIKPYFEIFNEDCDFSERRVGDCDSGYKLIIL